MTESTEVAVRQTSVPALQIEDLVSQVQLIQQAMSSVMKEGEHYGVIPGTNKPTLLKPGAEKLCLLFRLAPDYTVDKEYDSGGHLTVSATCRLSHIDSGNFVGSGEAMCTTYESKYMWRHGSRLCPECNKPAIIKGRQEYGGGWICFKKKDGCGAKFADDDVRILSQPEGRTQNEDLPDAWNTVMKMACKRALVAAVLNATAASDIFTQDLEDRDSSAPAEKTVKLLDQEAANALGAVLDIAASHDPVWEIETVLANASRKFKRKITSLPELSVEEAAVILQGANEFILSKSEPPAGSGEPSQGDFGDVLRDVE